MTTVAYKAGVIAADTMMCAHNAFDGHVTKIAKFGGLLAGAGGSSAMCRMWFDWLRGGLNGEPPKQIANEFDLDAFAVIPGGRLLYWDGQGMLHCRAEMYAVGSGAKFALGAMHAGATPEEAVRAAMAFDCFTGGDIEVLRA